MVTDEVEMCAMCGREVDSHERNVRFRLPDPVLTLPERELTPGTWMSHGEPASSVMMKVPEAGRFVRSLLPVHLTGGFTLTFGVWIGVSSGDFQHAQSLWWESSYESLTLEGELSNTLPRWGLLGAPVFLRVLDVDHTPYVTKSSSRELDRVLTAQWPHDVLDGIP